MCGSLSESHQDPGPQWNRWGGGGGRGQGPEVAVWIGRLPKYVGNGAVEGDAAYRPKKRNTEAASACGHVITRRQNNRPASPAVAVRHTPRLVTPHHVFSFNHFYRSHTHSLNPTLNPTRHHHQVALRGGALIKKWGRSSAASTAVSVADAIRALVVPTAPGDCFSTGVISDGNPYGVREGLIFSFPCR